MTNSKQTSETISDITWHERKDADQYYVGKWYLLQMRDSYFMALYDVETDGVGYWIIEDNESTILHIPSDKYTKYALISKLE